MASQGAGAVGFIWDESPDVMAHNIAAYADALWEQAGNRLDGLAAETGNNLGRLEVRQGPIFALP